MVDRASRGDRPGFELRSAPQTQATCGNVVSPVSPSNLLCIRHVDSSLSLSEEGGRERERERERDIYIYICKNITYIYIYIYVCV